ncbi:MAG: hypothetical protein EBU08_09615 [Micrococcales bacterium]|nr:hypothetical protein [Micrococcales bacterium]
MPNKRHPTRRFIGFWGTTFLKLALQKHAKKKGIPLSALIGKILWEFLQNNKKTLTAAALWDYLLS